MKAEHTHIIKEVKKGSIAEELGVCAGDMLLSVNGEEIGDIFDYRFQMQDTYVEVLIRKRGEKEAAQETEEPEEWLLEIDKEEDEDVGLVFGEGLMDGYRSCANKCIFCFIDQMPPGMRETLYFKDDDARLSFLQGNYVTLTNMSEEDIDRIIRYRMEPINISFQTTNPALRCKMLNNRFAGEALHKAKRLYDAEILMNGQIVLCKGVNDGAELDRSIKDLSTYLPYLQSVSVVPVGLTRFREKLYPLEPFAKTDAKAVLQTIRAWQERLYAAHGTHFVHASDEWYLLAEERLPKAATYDGYLQLENGVGMLRLLIDEVEEELERRGKRAGTEISRTTREVSVATGLLAEGTIRMLVSRLQGRCPGLTVHVYGVRNLFFGEHITVSGLLTGRDLIAQLAGRPLGETLFLPQNILRSGSDVFLDDVTVSEVSAALQVRVDIVKSSGADFVSALTGEDGND